MKPARFQYVDPHSVDEAVEFLAARPDEAKVLAGGQSLMPVINMRLARPGYLVDLSRVDDLDDIDDHNGDVRIGAMTTQRRLLDSSDIAARCPLMTSAMPWIGHTAIRQRGTLGGSLAHDDPSAELPAVAVALTPRSCCAAPAASAPCPPASSSSPSSPRPPSPTSCSSRCASRPRRAARGSRPPSSLAARATSR